MARLRLLLIFLCLAQISFSQIDLSLELDVDNTELQIFSHYAYTLTVENNGLTTADEIIVDIPVPLGMAFTNQNISQGQYFNWTGEWNLGALQPNTSATMELVLFTLTDNNPLSVYAQVTNASGVDTDSTPNNGACCTPNEDDEAVATIGGDNGGGNETPTGTDIELQLSVVDNTYAIYENVFYTLTASNTGTEAANNVRVSCPLPNGLVYTSDTPSQGQFINWTGDWNVGTIPAGQSATLDLVLFTLVDDVDITNYAQVTAMDENDSDSTPNNGTCCIANEDDEVAITITPSNGGGGNPTCNDGIQNGDETGVDCGGSNCPACPTCFDGIQNQGETGIDCGGPCTPCDGGGNSQEVGYTAKDQVTPYTGLFRPGVNMGYNPPWQDTELANLAAGNAALGINGVGAKSIRPGMFEVVTEIYGYDIRVDAFNHYNDLGMDDMTMIVGFPVDWHRDLTDYCGDGEGSALFANLYTDIWDNGENGTPYNDDNYYAAYLYQVVNTYKDYIKFWEIWNEPGFDLTGNTGWRQPGDPAGNWWDRDPYPCESILHAPIEHYIRTLRISWEIIKTLDPDDYVVVAGVGFESFLDAILRNTDNPNGGSITPDYPHRGGAYFDVMGFHTYPDIDGSVRAYNAAIGGFDYFRHSDAAAKGVTRRQNNYQAILDNYGYDGATYPKKEWIMTEFNVPRVQFNPNSMSSGDELQINYIIKATVEAMQANIRQIHAYTLGDKKQESEANTEFDLLGMYKYLGDAHPNNQEVNPIGISYKTTSDLLFGTTHDAQQTTAMNLPDNVGGGAFRKANGEYIYVLWAVTMTDQSEFASANYAFPSGLGIGQLYQKNWDYSSTGQSTPVNSQNLALTGQPIFLTETPDFNAFQQGRIITADASHLSVKQVLPNPASDYVELLVQCVETMPVIVDIYDATGVRQIQQTEHLRKGFSKIRFDISALPTGMYFIHIQDSNRKSTKIKFIKQQL